MFNFDYIIGEEVIDFQVNGKLGKMLTDTFNDVIEFKKNIDYSKVPNIAETRRKYRINEVTEFCKRVMAPKLKKVVLECCNLDIKNVILNSGLDFGLQGLYAMNIDISNVKDEVILDTLSRETGTGTISYAGSLEDSKLIKEFADVANKIDKGEARLTSRVFGKNSKPIFAQELYFDVNTSFLSEDFLAGEVYQPLTAEEIAAIIMHEIGHAMTVIEHAADLYFMHSRVKAMQINLKSVKLSETDIKKSLDSINTNLVSKLRKKLSDSDYLSELTKKRLTKIVDTCEAVINTVVQDPGAEHEESILWDVFRVSISLLLSLRYICISILAAVFQYLIFAPIMEGIWRNTWNRDPADRKTSDLGANHNRANTLERWADEFVSRQGYGPQLASGLKKIIALAKASVFVTPMDLFGPLDLSSSRLSSSVFYACLTSVVTKVLFFCNVLCWFDPSMYENDYRRTLRIAQNTYAFFKSSDKVPVGITKQWMDKIRQIEDEVQKVKRLRDTKIGVAINNIFTSITNPAKWIAYINSGNLDQDLTLLEDNIDDLSNNKLFYLSDKLKLG